jgi:8-oxo-dGTP pyrophosphatase MutT (NUDIX family)
MEIKFEQDGLKFNVRSSCIIKDKNHKQVLLSDMRGVKTHKAYILPGGRLDVLENSKEAIIREIQEELGVDINPVLVSVEEIIEKSTNFHMLEFIYYAEIDNFSLIKTLDDGWDKFKIVDLNEIDNYDIRPKTAKELIKQEKYDKINHNINYDWGEQ